MSERSFVHSAALVASIIAGAGCGARAPEADPAKIQAIAEAMIANAPPPGINECAGEQVIGGATLTMRTVLQLAKKPTGDSQEYAEYVNPPELDSPAARTLIDEGASTTDRRRAAAELAAAPFYVVYIVDIVSVPMAFEIKELKRGIVGARALRYDKQGRIECARVFRWQNDEAVSDAAIAASKKVRIDPAVAKRLRDDLTAQMLKRVAALGAPPPSGTMAVKPTDD